MALVDVCKPFALRQHLYSKIWLILVVSGEQFDVKDKKTKVQEAKKFKELLDDPKFE
jgi:hypothetical protein